LNVSYIPDQPIEASAFQSYGPFEGIKRDVWEGGIRMATVAWGPGSIPAGTTDDHPSQFHDWMATFADFAGTLPPARCDGVSLKPSLTKTGKQWPSQIYVEYKNGGTTPRYDDFAPSKRGRKRGQMQVVHVDGYKGIRVNIRSAQDPFEIYDLVADRQERRNLAGKSQRFAALQTKMQQTVLQWRMPNASAPRPYDRVPIPSVEVGDLLRGLRWRRLAGDFAYVPDLRRVPADATGIVGALDTAAVPGTDGAVEFSGWLNVPMTGEYRLLADSNSRMFLRVHEAALIDADHRDSPDQPLSAAIQLEAGLHPVRLTTLLSGDTPEIELRWQWPDADESIAIPDEAWFCQ
jgi:uncharacterized sulfatase